jgi:hypothetical protein
LVTPYAIFIFGRWSWGSWRSFLWASSEKPITVDGGLGSVCDDDNNDVFVGLFLAPFVGWWARFTVANRAREVRLTLGTFIFDLAAFLWASDFDRCCRRRWWFYLMARFDGDVDGSRADGLRGLVLMPVGFCWWLSCLTRLPIPRIINPVC